MSHLWKAGNSGLKWFWFIIGFIPVVPILILTATGSGSLEKQLTWFFGMVGYFILSVVVSLIMLVFTKLKHRGNYLKPLISGIFVGLVSGLILSGVVCGI